MAVNDVLYTDGSVELIQSTGETPIIYYVDGGAYVVHEYTAGGGGDLNISMSECIGSSGKLS